MISSLTRQTMKSEQKLSADISHPDWLASVESSAQNACAALRHPTLDQLALCQSELASIVQGLDEFCDRANQPPQSTWPGVAPRLWLLRKQVVLMQAMIRQAAAFYRGIEQVDTQTVLGYTPGGLERSW